jgi:hypothetical protein
LPTIAIEPARIEDAAEILAPFKGHKSAANIVLYRRLGYRPLRTERVNTGLELVYLEKLVT